MELTIQKSHEDERGAIFKLMMDGEHVTNILFTKAGYLRAGDLHPHDQFDFVLCGEVEITRKEDLVELFCSIKPNEVLKIPAGQPHIFRSETDSLVIERWNGPFECTYYKPYRDRVEAQMKEKKEIYTADEKAKVIERLKQVNYLD
jgi:mannose-6-phosphate isomerase-like protein (cupin superfamily)